MTMVEITHDFQYFHEADRPHNVQLVAELPEHIGEAIDAHLQPAIDGDPADEITYDIVAAAPELVPTAHDVVIIITARGVPDSDRELHWRIDFIRDHLRLWLPYSITYLIRIDLRDAQGERIAGRTSESRPSQAPREKAAQAAA